MRFNEYEPLTTLEVIQLVEMITGTSAKRNGDNWLCCCPAHDDKRASLAIATADDRVLMYCFKGCTFDEICNALDIQPFQLFNH